MAGQAPIVMSIYTHLSRGRFGGIARKVVRKLVGPFSANPPEPPQFPSVEAALQVLKKRGFEPGFAVDVGAYHGEWTRMFKKAFPRAKVLMIEAQDSKKAALDEAAASFGGDVRVETALLGAADGQSVLFHEMETGSSVFEEVSSYTRRATSKSTVSLDSLLLGKGCPRVDFLKLDVQGYELEILKGCPKLMGDAHAILLEASLVSVNAGCPLISEVIAFLHERGFRLFDFCSQIRMKDGVLWQTDLLFVRASSEVVPEARLTAENWG